MRNCCWYLCRPASAPLPLSRNELRHLLGTTACTFWTFALLLIGTLKHIISGPKGYKLLDAAWRRETWAWIALSASKIFFSRTEMCRNHPKPG